MAAALTEDRHPLTAFKGNPKPMSSFRMRRALLLATLSTPALAIGARAETGDRDGERRLVQLEAGSGGRLGVFALDSASQRRIGHRADERFPMCSTFKVLVAAAVLARDDAALLARRIRYSDADLLPHSPITGKHVDDGMAISELCAATIRYSDNAAANLLMRELGGPAGITAYARSIGDRTFRLDRWETELNSAIPGDERDTTSPRAMAQTLRNLTIGHALKPSGRGQLTRWLLGNTTGDARIRAGLPAAWKVGDKTGAGAYGTVNDVAVIWPPARAPIVLAVYFTHPRQDARSRSDVVASAARIVAEAWA